MEKNETNSNEKIHKRRSTILWWLVTCSTGYPDLKFDIFMSESRMKREEKLLLTKMFKNEPNKIYDKFVALYNNDFEFNENKRSQANGRILFFIGLLITAEIRELHITNEMIRLQFGRVFSCEIMCGAPFIRRQFVVTNNVQNKTNVNVKWDSVQIQMDFVSFVFHQIALRSLQKQKQYVIKQFSFRFNLYNLETIV